MDLPELLRALEDGDAKMRGEVAPGVYAYGAQRAMGRIRAYSSAGLSPFAGRGLPSEIQLMGHLHVSGDRIVRVEGFNGQEGERWARQAYDKAAELDALAPGATLSPLTPLRGCPHTGVR